MVNWEIAYAFPATTPADLPFPPDRTIFLAQVILDSGRYRMLHYQGGLWRVTGLFGTSLLHFFPGVSWADGLATVEIISHHFFNLS
jgi:hypothetical protein